MVKDLGRSFGFPWPTHQRLGILSMLFCDLRSLGDVWAGELLRRFEEIQAREVARDAVRRTERDYVTQEYLNELESEMFEAAKVLDFERAAELRDRIMQLKGDGAKPAEPETMPVPGRNRTRPRHRTRR